MATAPISQTKPQFTDAEERDGFVEYCKMRTCERMEAERVDELEEAGVDVDQMRVIAVEAKIEWRGFTDEMKMFWIDRGSIKYIVDAWATFLKANNASVPGVKATGPALAPSTVKPHDH